MLGPFIVVLLLIGIPGKSEELRGVITDMLSNPLPKASVFVHWDPVGGNAKVTGNIGISKPLHTLTSEDGTYSAELRPGVYDVFITSPGFAPACEKIRIKPKGEAVVDKKLKVSRVVFDGARLQHRLRSFPPHEARGNHRNQGPEGCGV